MRKIANKSPSANNLTASARFWKWSFYNNNKLHVISNLNLGDFGYLKISLYYDNFQNSLFACNDSNCTTQNHSESKSYQYLVTEFTLESNISWICSTYIFNEKDIMRPDSPVCIACSHGKLLHGLPINE